MMSNVKFEGVQETIQALEKKYGEKKTKTLTKKAINVGAEK